MNGDGLVAEVVGFNPPYYIANALRNPAITPRCDCGAIATKIARFIVVNGEGAPLAAGLMLCDMCAAILTTEDQGEIMISELAILAQAIRARDAAYWTRTKSQKSKLALDNDNNM